MKSNLRYFFVNLLYVGCILFALQSIQVYVGRALAGPSNISAATVLTSISLGVKTVSSGAYTIGSADYCIVCNLAGVTITLPRSGSAKGRVIVLKDRISVGNMVVKVPVGDNIDGAIDVTLQVNVSNTSLTFISTGSGWMIL